MFLEHPRLVAAYSVGLFTLVNAHDILIAHVRNMLSDEYFKTKFAHEKRLQEMQKELADATHAHEKYMLAHSRWWRRIF